MIQPDFEKGNGLVAAIVQDAKTGQVLMLGYMNQEALEITRRTNRVTFWSRSRQELWTKGDTSGNYLHVHAIQQDCDRDALLISATPDGPVCHNGTHTCWGDPRSYPGDIGFLGDLEQVIQQRLQEGNPESYTVKLQQKGTHKIAQKVGEEAVEVVIEALRGDKERLTEEAADLMYHLILLLTDSGLSLAEVAAALRNRHTRQP
jgi:phosphoribosyl-ATP pyrophosphohydrolase/phosphoribosyl-AMP cyclohydrolase